MTRIGVSFGSRSSGAADAAPAAAARLAALLALEHPVSDMSVDVRIVTLVLDACNDDLDRVRRALDRALSEPALAGWYVLRCDVLPG